MKHNIKTTGFSYRIRPVTVEDAPFIIETRLENEEKSQYIHRVSTDLKKQENWLNEYFKRPDDYYFVIENLFNGQKEGLISIYNIKGKEAEWGRWVLKNGSLAAVESVALIYQTAFEKLNLDELYTKTVEDNVSVVNFHKSINAKMRRVIENEFELDGKYYNAVEQYVDREYYFSDIKPLLETKTQKLFERNVKNVIGKFKFHHYGIAVSNINSAYEKYIKTYIKGDYFEDKTQGVKGLFIVSETSPTLELLENLPDSGTLNYYLEKKIEQYHTGYLVEDIVKAQEFFINTLGAKIVSDLKQSTYFKKRICFLLLKNKEMIELIES